MNKIDHIVVAASSLAQGVDYIRRKLGVEIPRGGFHATMGTHNHLMQLGNGIYLELIAVDPNAKAPGQPRWFALDEPLMRDSLRQSPRLITWVMNTPDIEAVRQSADYDVGIPTELQRNDLRWRIALTDDGGLAGGGMLPYVIQWHSHPHPSNAMADLGCRLQSLEIYHNRVEWLKDRLVSIGAEELVTVHSIDDTQSPFLLAGIETPAGVRTLSTLVDRDN